MKCLKVMEGRNGICTMFRGVLNHLTGTTYCEVEFSPGQDVVEQIFDEDKDDYENADSEYSGFILIKTLNDEGINLRNRLS